MLFCGNKILDQRFDPILKQVILQHLNYIEGTCDEKREC
jgi:hypothetical protein